MTTRKPISAEEFRRKLERSEETVQALSNPTLHGLKTAMKAFSAAAETLPAVGGGVFDMKSEGVLPRSFDVGPVSAGLGTGWQPQVSVGDRNIPLVGPGLLEAIPAMFPGVRDYAAPDPRSVSAFSEFVSPTEGQERPSFGETFSTLAEVHEERPWHEQLAIGAIEPVGNILTGGFGVAKGIGLAAKAGSQLLRRTPAATKALKTVLTTPKAGAVSKLDEAIRAATKAENWEELLRLSAEQKRLGMPGVGEGVTGMSKRWAEDVYTPPGPIQVQEP